VFLLFRLPLSNDLLYTLETFNNCILYFRYAMVVKDGKVAAINIEDDSTKATCTKGSGVLPLL